MRRSPLDVGVELGKIDVVTDPAPRSSTENGPAGANRTRPREDVDGDVEHAAGSRRRSVDQPSHTTTTPAPVGTTNVAEGVVEGVVVVADPVGEVEVTTAGVEEAVLVDRPSTVQRWTNRHPSRIAAASTPV